MLLAPPTEQRHLRKTKIIWSNQVCRDKHRMFQFKELERLSRDHR